MDSYAISAYGNNIGIRFNVHSGLDAIAEMFPPHWQLSNDPLVEYVYSLILHDNKPGTRVRRYNIAYADGVLIAKDFNKEAVLREFALDLKVSLGLTSPLYVFIHAGVVSWNGKLVVIPAGGMSGKSTLVTELVRAGATYYSDEIAIIDSSGNVHPYPSQIALRDGTQQVKRRVTVAELSGSTGSEPRAISMVLSTRYKEGATWRPRTMNMREGIMAMFDQCFSAHRDAERGLNWIKKAIGGAELLHSPRGEAEQVVNYLRKHFGDLKPE